MRGGKRLSRTPRKTSKKGGKTVRPIPSGGKVR